MSAEFVKVILWFLFPFIILLQLIFPVLMIIAMSLDEKKTGVKNKAAKPITYGAVIAIIVTITENIIIATQFLNT